MEQRRISMVGVVATSSGAVLAASTVLLSATLAFADPASQADDLRTMGRKPLPTADRGGMDLPVMAPVFDPSTPVAQTPDPIKPKKVDVLPPPPAPRGQPQPGQDPSDTSDTPPVFFGEAISGTRNSIIYVIDNSGSMSMMVEPYVDENGQTVRNGTRLDRAKAELRRSIVGLPESFSFNILFFDECVVSCFEARVQATASNKQAAFGWLSQVQPDGWTNSGLAVATALADKQNTTVVLLSDGAPNFLDCAMNYVGSYDQHRELIRRENTQGARIDTFGIGVASVQDARAFMQAVASDNSGSYIEID